MADTARQRDTIVSPSPGRPNELCEGAPGGGYICWSAAARPTLTLRHIDGPYVRFRNGELHWLTWRERLAVRMGRVDAAAIERKR